MRVRSTGLGPQELKIEPEDMWLERKGRFLIFHMESSEPVRWHLRTALTSEDIGKVVELLLEQVLSGSILSLLFKGAEGEEEPQEY
jgi:hypothetical protein